MKVITILLLCGALAFAQAPPVPPARPAPPKGAGSVSGHFYDADTGAILPNFIARGPDSGVKSDDQGVYRIKGLPPGPQQLRISGWPDFISASVNVPAGEELTGVDFRLRRDGEITGRVTDRNKDPIQGMRVCEMAREYLGGRLYYFADGCASSDDRGQYILRGIRAARAFFVLAEVPFRQKVAISSAPAKPELRLPAYRPTYYPSAEAVDGAEAIKLRSGEQRERVDIQVLRAPQYCIDALLTSQGAPASLSFRVTDELTSSTNMTPGSSSSGGFSPASGPDGKIRVCDLYSGRFRIAAFVSGSMNPSTFGVASVDIGQQDVAGVRVNTTPPIDTPGQALWEGPPADRGVAGVFSFAPRPVTNDPVGSSVAISPQGDFVLRGWPGLDYILNPFSKPAVMPYAYLKDVTYGNLSVFHTWFRIGSAAGDARFRIAMGNDGGLIHISASDSSGKVAANNRFLILPASAASEAVLSDAMIVAQGGPSGDYTSSALAPGKYYVFATDDLIDKTPEAMSAVWRERSRGTEVEVTSGATVEAKVETHAILERH